MKKFLLITAVSLLIGPQAVSRLSAQGIAGPAGIYDTRTVGTVTGNVIALRAIPPSEIAAGGIVIVLQTPFETIPVYVFPEEYLESRGFPVRVNDPGVTVTGSRIVFDNQTIIVAATVINGDRILLLRNTASGIPLY